VRHDPAKLTDKVALVTGGARRIGAAIVRALHAQGMTIALHYRESRAEAESLRDELEAERAGSVHLFQADVRSTRRIVNMVAKVVARCERLDAVVNNASSFYAARVGSVGDEEWDDLMGTNLRAPFFVSQATAPHLRATHGAIVNITDIYARRPLAGYPVYCAAKAGLGMLTAALALELGPAVRVNAVAPGTILWPEPPPDEITRKRIVAATALRRQGEPAEIARAVVYLLRDATYTTGQTLTVDGGRTLGV